MSFGYPGDNLHLEHHGVSEESFWPSFTDIMMVIVMVFLLVTIAVILNNWTLIADLKESIAKQQLASSMADNKEVENISLEAKLTYLEKQLAVFKKKTAEEQEKVASTQAALSKEQEKVANTQAALSKEQERVASTQAALSKEQEKVANTQAALSKEQEKVASTQAALSKEQEKVANTQSDLSRTQAIVAELSTLSREQKASIEATEKSLLASQELLENKDKQISTLTEDRNKKDKTLENKVLALSLMTNNKASLKVKVDSLQNELSAAIQKMSTLIATNEKLESNKISKNDLNAKLQLINKEVEEKEEALQRMQKENERVQSEIVSLKTKMDASVTGKKSAETKITEIKEQLTEANKKVSNTEEQLLEANKKVSNTEEKLAVVNKKLADINSRSDPDSENDDEEEIADLESEITEKDKIIAALKNKQSEGESQLRSLQGEYDSLDSKYQKLLRPARSSKGKYIVSVSYKKVAGKKTIRLKSGPDKKYKTLSKREMDKALEKLKNKHKSDLYVKIIIPEKSGLSYNEAWRFTSTLQKKYDYYFQPDNSSKSKSKTETKLESKKSSKKETKK